MRRDIVGRLTFRITFSDVDLVQFFFADYYRWMERALAELMAGCEYSRTRSFADGLGFPIVESGCRYLRPANVDQTLTVAARFEDMTERSFRVSYQFHREDTLLAEGFTQHVCVRLPELQAHPVPDEFRTQPNTEESRR